MIWPAGAGTEWGALTDAAQTQIEAGAKAHFASVGNRQSGQRGDHWGKADSLLLPSVLSPVAPPKCRQLCFGQDHDTRPAGSPLIATTRRFTTSLTLPRRGCDPSRVALVGRPRARGASGARRPAVSRSGPQMDELSSCALWGRLLGHLWQLFRPPARRLGARSAETYSSSRPYNSPPRSY